MPGVDETRVGQAYASVAELYIELFGASEKVHADDLALIERHLVGRAGRVLDLGCGPGHITGHLRARGVDAAGVDLVPEFIAHARATHPGVAFHVGTMARLDVADYSVVGVLAWYSLIHVPPPDLDGRLAELRRVLAPGGALVLGLFPADELGAFDHKVATAYRWPLDEIARRLARAGFTEVERLQRPADGDQRPQAAIAAVATATWSSDGLRGQHVPADGGAAGLGPGSDLDPREHPDADMPTTVVSTTLEGPSTGRPPPR